MRSRPLRHRRHEIRQFLRRRAEPVDRSERERRLPFTLDQPPALHPPQRPGQHSLLDDRLRPAPTSGNLIATQRAQQARIRQRTTRQRHQHVRQPARAQRASQIVQQNTPIRTRKIVNPCHTHSHGRSADPPGLDDRPATQHDRLVASEPTSPLSVTPTSPKAALSTPKVTMRYMDVTRAVLGPSAAQPYWDASWVAPAHPSYLRQRRLPPAGPPHPTQTAVADMMLITPPDHAGPPVAGRLIAAATRSPPPAARRRPRRQTGCRRRAWSMRAARPNRASLTPGRHPGRIASATSTSANTASVEISPTHDEPHSGQPDNHADRRSGILEPAWRDRTTTATPRGRSPLLERQPAAAVVGDRWHRQHGA